MEEPLFNRHGGVYYDPKNPANLKDFENRQLYLRAAEQKVEGFSNSLLEVALPLIAVRIQSHGSLPTPSAPDFEAFGSQIMSAVQDWAKSFHIDVAWVHQQALDALDVKLFHIYEKIDSTQIFGMWRRSITSPRLMTFELPGWDPLVESESRYVARADREWRRLRSEYVGRAKAELDEHNFKRVPSRRKRRLSPELRFEWAALHRCAGVSIESLADQYREETEAIRISVSRTLAELGL
jgi:hypothetical protein